MLRTLLTASLISFNLLSPLEIAQIQHSEGSRMAETAQFQRIEQPIWIKGAITLAGLGLLGLELWWFLGSKPQSKKASSNQGIQEITITVDGGYQPSRVVVHSGQPVRLNFERHDSNSCLEEIRLPDFQIQKQLPLNQMTTVEFTPNQPGNYEFTCGMNMFRGVIEVTAST
ncbi:MAG: cupredoxin domain-containing protein [Oscillatoriales cyanobacterium RM2_1_1]|nr:cupredoxin domain-containing protein [Oscillatoriales cyanobacterium SM2_3_0]NJO45468.1 cupredoxin domain-containing protein [Oscillatoriales cyanobacterium RM2_1_1]